MGKASAPRRVADNEALAVGTTIRGSAQKLGLVAALMSVPTIASVTNFTYAIVARNNLALHGFIGMVLFGCLYYIIPRLAQVNWPSESSIRVHFLCSVIGVALLSLGLGAGGVLQGMKLANADVPFMDVVRGTV